MCDDIPIQYRNVTDIQTDRRTDRIAISIGLLRVSIAVLMRDKYHAQWAAGPPLGLISRRVATGKIYLSLKFLF